jgi:DNA-binding beta-propeller fold protein YncE
MKPKLRSLFVTVPLLCALTVVTCKRQRALEWRGTITEKDGVLIVENPREPLFADPGINVVQDLTIGQQSDKPEYMFAQIRDIEVDAQGNIYAVESKEKNVRVFDRKGAYLRSIGGPGQGPGEFNEPADVHVNSAGEVIVTDGASRSVKFFSSDGTYLRQYLLKTSYPILIDHGAQDVFYIMDFSMQPPGFKLSRLDIRAGESSPLASWAMPMPDPKRASIFDPIMSFAVMPDDRLLYGCPTEGYEIRVFSPNGRLERRILKDWDRRPITAEEKEALINEVKKRAPSGPVHLEFPEYHPPYRVVRSDDSGRIIVHAYSKFAADPSQKTESRFDIFDREGRYLARFGYPFKTLIEKPMVWRAGKFYTVEQDEEGYLYIARYAAAFKL